MKRRGSILAPALLLLSWAAIEVSPSSAQEPDPLSEGPPPRAFLWTDTSNGATWRYFQPAGSVGQSFFDGVGYPQGFTNFQGVIPWMEEAGASLLFSDIRVFLDNDSAVSGTFGLVYREYLPGLNRPIGTYLYYDSRDTGRTTFSQLSGGIETLGTWFDAHWNYYAPVGQDQKVVDEYLSVTGLRYTGNYLLRDRARQFQTSMYGTDLEVSSPVPYLGQMVRVFTGGYHFQGQSVKQVWGVTGGVRLRPIQQLEISANVQNDTVFDTTANLVISIWFPNISARNSNPLDGVASRMGEPVRRFQNIVVQESAKKDEVIALGSNGLPLFFVHFEPNATGSGTFESPIGNLPEAVGRAGGTTNSFIIVRPDAGGLPVFDGQLSLLANQHLFSNNRPFEVTSNTGAIYLPHTPGPSPIFTNTAPGGNGIKLNDNNEVGGISIVGAQGSAILANGIDSFFVHDSNLENSAMHGFRIIDLAGTGTVKQNTISTNDQEGISVTSPSGGAFTLNVEQNTIQSNGNSGLFATLSAGTTATINVTDNYIYSQPVNVGAQTNGDSRLEWNVTHNRLDSSTVAVLAQALEQSRFFGNASGNSIDTVSLNAILLNAQSDAQMAFSVDDNRINNVSGSGIVTNVSSNSVSQISITGNTLSNLTNNAIEFVTFDSSILNAGVEDNTISTTSNGVGILFSLGDSSQGGIVVQRNNISDTLRPGIGLSLESTSRATFAINDNVLNRVTDDGISVDLGGTSVASGQIRNNQIDTVFRGGGTRGRGIRVTVGQTADPDTDDPRLSVAITGNSIQTTPNQSILVETSNSGQVSVGVRNNTSLASNLLSVGQGIHVQRNETSAIALGLTGNSSETGYFVTGSPNPQPFLLEGNPSLSPEANILQQNTGFPAVTSAAVVTVVPDNGAPR
ncbi:MAG: right-handed parallel beta-helix repeat-containing protein [Planctomycetota bacterium]